MRLCLAIACLAIIAGCDSVEPERVAIHGTVTLDGVLVPKAGIVFIPVEGTLGPKATGIIENGKYEIPEHEGPLVGHLRVEIRSGDAVPLDDVKQFRKLPSGELPPDPIPAQYNDSSTLQIETKRDADNTFDFGLTTTMP